VCGKPRRFSLPVRKVCIADDPRGLSKDIEVVEIPQLPVSDLLYQGEHGQSCLCLRLI